MLKCILVPFYIWRTLFMSLLFVLLLQNGWTALYWAANYNHPDTIKLLISNGADMTVINEV